jgi:phasin family protein
VPIGAEGAAEEVSAAFAVVQPPRKRIMGKSEARKNSVFDVARALGEYRIPALDVDAVVESQRRNLEALTHASQLAAEGVRAVTQRQAEIAQQSIEQASGLFREWTQPAAPAERLVRQVEASKQTFEKAVADARELAELVTKAGTEVFGIVARRASESLDEMRLFAEKQTVESGKAAD